MSCPIGNYTVDIVGKIANNAFYQCRDMTTVIIGDAVTQIGDYAFQDCSGLTSVTIGASVTGVCV